MARKNGLVSSGDASSAQKFGIVCGKCAWVRCQRQSACRQAAAGVAFLPAGLVQNKMRVRLYPRADPVQRHRSDMTMINLDPFDLALLAALQSGEALDSNIISLSGLLPRRFDDASETTVAGQFGGEFSAALFALDIEQWTGPVQSPFGTHLVRIDQIVEARVPLLDEIRDVVQREWLMDRRQAGQAALFDQLRAKYVITIEEFDDSSP